jgi:uncharacterized membrane protein YhaH (DUF805 family)
MGRRLHVSGDASPQRRRRWWAALLAVLAVAVVPPTVAFVLRPDEMLQALAGIVAGLAVIVLLMWAGLGMYNRRESALQAELGPTVWAHRCIDPDYPPAWLSVVVSDEAVAVLGRKHRVRDRWPLESIVDVVVEPMTTGFAQHTCLTLLLHGGARVSLALPSRNTLSFPRSLAEEAQAEIQRRRAKLRT